MNVGVFENVGSDEFLFIISLLLWSFGSNICADILIFNGRRPEDLAYCRLKRYQLEKKNPEFQAGDPKVRGYITQDQITTNAETSMFNAVGKHSRKVPCLLKKWMEETLDFLISERKTVTGKEMAATKLQ